MISPTGTNQIRVDTAGSGHYGASRGNHPHDGTDYICSVGQEIVAPISGKIVRRADPYGDKQYGGIVIKNQDVTVKMFYFSTTVKPGEFVKMGQVIGKAQDISKRWGDNMKPHIHLEISSINPDVLISMLS